MPPDLAIIDLSLTDSSGFSLFRELLNRYPKLRILVLSMHDEAVYAPKVLQAGAHGYLMKQEATTIAGIAMRFCSSWPVEMYSKLRYQLASS